MRWCPVGPHQWRPPWLGHGRAGRSLTLPSLGATLESAPAALCTPKRKGEVLERGPGSVQSAPGLLHASLGTTQGPVDGDTGQGCSRCPGPRARPSRDLHSAQPAWTLHPACVRAGFALPWLAAAYQGPNTRTSVPLGDTKASENKKLKIKMWGAPGCLSPARCTNLMPPCVCPGLMQRAKRLPPLPGARVLVQTLAPSWAPACPKPTRMLQVCRFLFYYDYFLLCPLPAMELLNLWLA